jgi:hypothetical protein
VADQWKVLLDMHTKYKIQAPVAPKAVQAALSAAAPTDAMKKLTQLMKISDGIILATEKPWSENLRCTKVAQAQKDSLSAEAVASEQVKFDNFQRSHIFVGPNVNDPHVQRVIELYREHEALEDQRATAFHTGRHSVCAHVPAVMRDAMAGKRTEVQGALRKLELTLGLKQSSVVPIATPSTLATIVTAAAPTPATPGISSKPTTPVGGWPQQPSLFSSSGSGTTTPSSGWPPRSAAGSPSRSGSIGISTPGGSTSLFGQGQAVGQHPVGAGYVFAS